MGCSPIHIMTFLIITNNLIRLSVGVGQTTHARHHAQHVVVQRIHAHLGSPLASHGVDGHSQLQSRLVDTREVARARRLVLLRPQRKRVYIDTRRRRARVVLERLHLVEVRALPLSEPVLTVELQLGYLNRVLALAPNTSIQNDLREQVVHARLELRRTSNILGLSTILGSSLDETLTQSTSYLRTSCSCYSNVGTHRSNTHRRIHTGIIGLSEQRHNDTIRREVIGVVERLRAANRRHPRRRRAIDERIALHYPLELLHGVVKVQLDLVGRRRDRLRTSVLHLLNQILMRLLREPAALLSVEVDVVNIQGRGRQRLSSQRVGRYTDGRLSVLAVLPRLEVDVDAHLVILERNQGDGQTGVAAEPELQRNVESLRGRAGAGYARDGRLSRRAGRIQGNAVTALHQHEIVGVANQRLQRAHRARLSRQLGPDLHPVTILAINALATNLNLHLLDQAVTNVVQPPEARRSIRRTRSGRARPRRVRRAYRDLRQYYLDVRLVHQIRVTVDDRRYTLVEVRLTVESYFNGLHCKVGVPLVQHLPERNLGVARNIDVLCAIAH